ncbi:hypothetical protein ABMA27_015916 [Loxostege sticticalis]|uniref:Uncharacterized protein n=1 Tax=Loxostege sticticalis TaxID=481309 RepID=A0ABR3I4U7_LOXSC
MKKPTASSQRAGRYYATQLTSCVLTARRPRPYSANGVLTASRLRACGESAACLLRADSESPAKQQRNVASPEHLPRHSGPLAADARTAGFHLGAGARAVSLHLAAGASVYDFLCICKDLFLKQDKCLCALIVLIAVAFFTGILIGAATCGSYLGRFNSPILSCIDNFFIPDSYTTIKETYLSIT